MKDNKSPPIIQSPLLSSKRTQLLAQHITAELRLPLPTTLAAQSGHMMHKMDCITQALWELSLKNAGVLPHLGPKRLLEL